ncbi:MAG: SAM-dependent methyltransferase [Flavobacteriales bacterium]|nr:SAM-dependent methyltransferase [Flavobacteriales bacterium]|tara:strand:- start:948 stop:1676 length:729 start_codon:yes stop_codon:yes gene_type:complete
MNWFANWFDSEYYHILYNNRDKLEANLFIDNILKKFQPPDNAFFLDLACGSGRHSIYLNKKGYNVDGVDLSKKSLLKGKSYQNDTLKFIAEDIRSYKKPTKYDFILNLFTSFGYFETENDDINVLRNVKISLKKNGIFILDFFNANKVILDLKSYEEKKINNITFKIKKTYDQEFVYKEISIQDQKNNYIFTEKVRLIKLEKFKKYMRKLNMNLISIFGDYQFREFNPVSSERLILVIKKQL